MQPTREEALQNLKDSAKALVTYNTTQHFENLLDYLEVYFPDSDDTRAARNLLVHAQDAYLKAIRTSDFPPRFKISSPPESAEPK